MLGPVIRAAVTRLPLSALAFATARGDQGSSGRQSVEAKEIVDLDRNRVSAERP